MRRKKVNWLGTIILSLGSLSILFPLYITIITAFKTTEELATNSFLALPETWSFQNFTDAIEMTNFFRALGNSLIITIPTVILVVLLHSLVGYVIARNLYKKWVKVVYYYIVSGMFVPISIIMLPLVRQTALWGLDNRFGMIILNLVMHLAFHLFLYVSYIKTIPVALEEAAYVDGASEWKIFWYVVFPLLKPMNATVGILITIATWNDFMLPLVILGGQSELATIPLTQYIFESEFSTDYTLAFASYLLAMLPMLVAYLFGQKRIINSVGGAVKE
ncbi:ABC transporter permease [Tetragenococcus halophilus subsp. flandriensis]|uniref:carbohydrate ABC transporter permease n=1 Tax=Tetragenococcus halophilus TaxID=51669 RepID=UPI0023E92CAE|nr:carbohydrate ABC transporter permease [Tetragenococcus halophilus]GMA07943.1 ABC transporter permease [Tetragenococcus halophilus subsp. flandriensis]